MASVGSPVHQPCSVCLADFSTRPPHRPRVLECGHPFCERCVDNLIERGIEDCPTCRHPYEVAPIDYGHLEALKNMETLAGRVKNVRDELKKNEEALRQFKNLNRAAIETCKKYAPPIERIKLGIQSIEFCRFQDAQDLFLSVMQDPKATSFEQANARLEYGIMCAKTNNSREALGSLIAVICDRNAYDRDRIRACFESVILLIQVEEYMDAIRYLQMILSPQGDLASYSSPQDKASAKYNLAVLSLLNGNHEEAAQVFQEIIKDNVASREQILRSHLKCGMIHSAYHRYPEAIAHFDVVRADLSLLMPEEQMRASFEAGYAYLRGGQPELGQKILNEIHSDERADPFFRAKAEEILTAYHRLARKRPRDQSGNG